MSPQRHGTHVAILIRAFRQLRRYATSIHSGLCGFAQRNREARNLLCAYRDLEIRAAEVVAERLTAAAEMGSEECLGDGGEGQAVFGHGKAVALLWIEHICDRQSLGLHGF